MSHYVKATTVATWLLAMAAAGLLAVVTSSTSWLALVAGATVPPLLLMRSIASRTRLSQVGAK